MTIDPFRAVSVAVCALLALCGTSFAQEATYEDDETNPLAGYGRRYTFYYENDQFNDTDDHYTFGGRFSVTAPKLRYPKWMLDFPLFELRGWDRRADCFVGLQFYTPRELRIATPQLNDRPWAGWLHAGLALSRFGPKGGSEHKFMEKLELTVGIVGPGAGAKDVQTTIHSVFGGAEPQGWHHQLRNEPALNILYAHKRRLGRKDFDKYAADAFVTYGYSLGNVLINGNLGFEFRFGKHLPVNFGLDRLGATAYAQETPIPRFRIHGILGGEGKLVAHNIFLDGNTFEDSHSVDKEPWVDELFFGVGLLLRDRWILSAVQVVRSSEFELQDHSNRFVAINASRQF